MEKLQKLAIILFILASLVPAFYINKWLQKVIQPRKSFLLLIFYMLTVFALVFVYTFLVVLIISNLFQHPKR